MTVETLVKHGEMKTVVTIPAWAQELMDEQTLTGNTTQAYAKSPILYRAIQLRANALSGMPFQIMRGNQPAEFPFPLTPLAPLLYQMELSLLLMGATFVLKQNSQKGHARVVGLQWLNPNTVQVHYKNGLITFTQSIRGRIFGPWEPERMVYLREFSMADEVGFGVAPASVALMAANLRTNISEFSTAFFRGGAQPMTLLTIEGNPPVAELERTQRFFGRAMAGVKNAFRVLALRSEVKVQPITPNLNTMAFPDLSQHTIKEIGAAFGVPITMLESNAANYATATSDTLNFYEGTITPRLRFYENEINKQLLDDYGLTLKFLPESLAIYQADEADRSGALVNLVQAGLPLKTALTILGYALEDYPNLDFNSTVPTEPAPEQQDKQSTPKPETQVQSKEKKNLFDAVDEYDEVADLRHRQQTEHELKVWLKIAKKDLPRALKFDCNFLPNEAESWLKNAMMDKQSTLDVLFGHVGYTKAVLKTRAESVSATTIRRVLTKYGKDAIQKAAKGDLPETDIRAMVTDIAQSMVPIYRKVYLTKLAATSPEPPDPAGLEPDEMRTMAQDWAEKYAYDFLSPAIEKTSLDSLRKVIGKLTTDNASSFAEVANDLYKLFSPMRAEMIAVTEVTRAKSAAVNEYQVILDEIGIPSVRRWTTRLDEKVCEICSPHDFEKEKSWVKAFPEGPPAHPRCRCSISIEEVDFDLEGGVQDFEQRDDYLGVQPDEEEEEENAQKYNRVHDKLGRFASGGGSGSVRQENAGGGSEGAVSFATSPSGFPPIAHPPLASYVFNEMGRGGSAIGNFVRNEDGTYSFTPERQALHTAIIERALAGIPVSSNPTQVFMGGGPAAGKSHLLAEPEVGKTIPDYKSRQAVHSDPDEIKKQLPEWETAGANKAAFTHAESSYLTKRIVEEARIRKLDIVSDGTGNHSVSDMKGKIDGARKAGYKVVGIYATVPTQDALTRAQIRGQQTGRFVPPEVIVNTHAGVSKIFSTIAPMFDKVTLYETSGKPILLASSEGGKPLVVHNTQLFAAFEAKAFEMFRPTE